MHHVFLHFGIDDLEIGLKTGVFALEQCGFEGIQFWLLVFNFFEESLQFEGLVTFDLELEEIRV